MGAVFALALTLAGCEIATSALVPPDAAPPDADPADTAVSDSGLRDATPSDAPVGDGGPRDADAGPARPTPVVTVPATGERGAQPAVLFDGSELVVGLISAGHVELIRMTPGRVSDVRERVTATASSTRQDVVLSSDGGRLAVAWTEEDAAEASLVARTLPDDPAPRKVAGDLFREGDRQDAAIYATRGGFGAVFRGEVAPGVQQLSHVDVAGGGSTAFTTGAGSLGELDLFESSLGPLLVHGRPQSIWRREDDSWVLAAALVLGDGSEGAIATLGDGTVASVWLHASATSTGRVLSFARHRPGVPWMQQGTTTRLSVEGSDPALAPFDGGVLLAFVYQDTAARTLGLAALDEAGNFVAGPCRVPPIAPAANDPDVACGGGWCAVVWMEASDYTAADYVTRVIQVPDDRDNLCP